MTRSEHVRWAKERALQELQYGGPEHALASIVSDLGKHEETRGLTAFASAAGTLEAKKGTEAMRRFIDGFAE
jgi:hypothetical protein